MILPDINKIEQIVRSALIEDIGNGDITSNCTISEELTCNFSISNREPIILSGAFIAAIAFEIIDPEITIEINYSEGDKLSIGSKIITGNGNARSVLLAERVALNFLQHTCGIATLTSKYVEKISGTNAKILDTRKTTPLLRDIEKYAVRCGGGHNHRIRLDDGILIKDNHIEVSGSITNAIKNSQRNRPSLTKIEIECETINQVEEALTAGADVIMLDNMNTDLIQKCVNLVEGRVKLEASGNINMDTIEDIAKTGVDYISIGRITHSFSNSDIGLDIIT